MHYKRAVKNKIFETNKIIPDDTKRFHESYILASESDCWLWEKSLTFGYGNATWEGQAIYAHRLSWIIHNGPIPEGMLVCHHCDVKNCVNPEHLFVGTQKDNMQDCAKKGRVKAFPSAEEHPLTPFKWSDIYEIRKLYRDGMSFNALSKKYRVCRSSITKICRNKSWKEQINAT